MTMTFESWWKSVAAHRMTWSRKEVARYAWEAAAQEIREECARVCEVDAAECLGMDSDDAKAIAGAMRGELLSVAARIRSLSNAARQEQNAVAGQRDIEAGEVPAGEQPMCDKCGNVMIATRARAAKRKP